MNKKYLAYVICSIVILLGVFYSHSFNFDSSAVENEEMAKGKVVAMKVLEDYGISETGASLGKQWTVTVKVTSGPYKGQSMKTLHTYGMNPAYDFLVNIGDQVVLSIESENQQLTAVYIADLYREKSMLYLIVAFLISIILIGSWQGVSTIISLGLTALAVGYILLPGILSGQDPIVVTIITCTGITIVTHMLVTGYTRKSTAAILGTFFGILIGGLIAKGVIDATHVNGLSSEESRLFFISYADGKLDITGILFAGIVLGSLGAVMDVAMSIASSVQEIHEANPLLTRSDLVKRGLNVGRDIIGTMANTLILANTGSALPLMLLISANNVPYFKLINLDMIVSEVIRALSGSIGLFLAVPITAGISAALIKYDKDDHNQEAQYFNHAAKNWDNDKREKRGLLIAEEIKIELIKSFGSEKISSQSLTALEFGCGTGIVGFKLMDSVGSMTFSDLSEEMIRVVNEKIEAVKKTEGLESIALKTHCATYGDAVFDGKKFDLIVTSMALHHIKDTSAVIQFFYDHLNVNGCACIVDLDHDNGDFHKDESHFEGHHGFIRSDFSMILQRNGFDVITDRIIFNGTKETSEGEKSYSLFLMVAQK